MSLPCKWQYVIIDPTERPLSPLQLLFCGCRQLADSWSAVDAGLARGPSLSKP